MSVVAAILLTYLPLYLHSAFIVSLYSQSCSCQSELFLPIFFYESVTNCVRVSVSFLYSTELLNVCN